jgi:Alpha/beta hydrolase domain
MGQPRNGAAAASILPSGLHLPGVTGARHRNVIGGVRTPAVDVPVSTLSGSAPAGTSTICALFGSTTPFSPSTLVTLYHSRSHYLAAYRADLARSIGRGYILPADRPELMANAQQVAFPSSR